VVSVFYQPVASKARVTDLQEKGYELPGRTGPNAEVADPFDPLPTSTLGQDSQKNSNSRDNY
jgi:hypothetical protein